MMEGILYSFYITFIYENRWQFFLDGFMMTMLLTVASFLGGTIVGAVMCALRLSKSKAVSRTVTVICNLLVQLPTLVLLMVFAYLIFGNADISIVLVVLFGLILKAAAYLSELFYAAVTGVQPGQVEAARTLGMTKVQAFMYISFPQALETMVPLYQNQFIITLQETSLVGTLAIQDITKAANVITARTYDAVFSLILVSVIYLLIGFICTRLLGLLRNKKHLGGESK